MTTKKIALIECWLGKFPPWYNLYLLTCLRNPEVDWIVFHDQPPPARHPKNVTFHSLTRSELEDKAARLFGRKISISGGYKICDLRPAYGVLFRDYLSNYVYWGYADNDVFFGNISAFITDELLANYEVVSACRCCTSGQFTIFRNAGICARIHEIIPEYVEALSRHEYAGLDELSLDTSLLNYRLESIRVHRRQLQIFDTCDEKWKQWAERLELEEKGHLNELFWEGGETVWQDGDTVHIASQKPAMFMHFMTWKKRWELPTFPYWPTVFRHFVVSEEGINVVFQRKQFLSCIYFAARYQTPVLLARLLRPIRRRLGNVKRSLQKSLQPG